ncbi:MAG: hypothetical protein SGPRY_008330, partial [Prymnesium sp.]
MRESDEGEDEEGMEHEMGELDKQQQQVVDERLWEKGEDELQPSADEKVERDAPVGESAESQMEAKEEEEGRKKKQTKEERAAEEGEQKEGEQKEEGEGEGAEEGEGDQEGDDEGEAEEDGVRPQTEYEDSNYKDLSNPPKENGEEDQMPEDLPDGIDEAEGGDDGDENEGGDGEGGEVEEGEIFPLDGPDEKEETPQPEGEGEEAMKPAEEGAEPNEEVTEPDGLPEGAGVEAQAEDEDGEEEREGEEAAAETASKIQYEHQQAFDDVKGSNSAMEQPAQNPPAEAEAEGGEREASAASAPQENRGGEGQPEEYSVAVGPSGEKGETKRRSQPAPNPFSELGNALEHWHRELELVKRQAEQGKEPPEEPAGVEEKPALEEGVMADATQEQCEEQREDVLDASERRSEGGQDDRMDVDKPEEGAMETAPSGADISQQGRPSSRKPQVEGEEGKEKPPQPLQPAHCPPSGEGEGLSAGTHVGPVGEDGVGSGKVGEVEDENEVEDSMLEQLQNEYEGEINQWHARPDAASAEAMWRQFELRTSALAQELSEQLRLILEATVASKLQGDYRTGKRISMRKVIPYIASGFRKDKIWLRRTKPSKREYQ